jgi:hypothetical protein
MKMGEAQDTYNPIFPGRVGEEPPILYAREAQLGRTLRVPRTSGVPMPLITATGATKAAMMVTLHAQVVIPADALVVGGADRRAPLTGVLQWGQAGATFSCKFDLRTGVCATLVASSVQLSAVFEAPDTDPDTRALFADVAAACVWGTRASRSRVTRTLPRASIANGASATFEVPPFATTLTVFTTAATFYAAASTSTVTLHGGPLVTDDPELVVTAGALGAGPLTLDGVALSGHTRFVTITNHEGATIPVQLTFGLAI